MVAPFDTVVALDKFGSLTLNASFRAPAANMNKNVVYVTSKVSIHCSSIQ